MANVLIVRPVKTDDPLPALLQRQGHNVHRFPVMEIVPLPLDEIVPARFDMAVFTSANAVQIGLDQMALPDNMPCFAVGEATAAALRQKGYHPVTPPRDFSSEGLLALPELQQLSGKNLLLFKGQGGRPLLPQQLRRRGATVRCCDVYRRQCCERHRDRIQALIAGGTLDAVMVHSGEVLNHLMAQAGGSRSALVSLPVIVPGERVATLAAAAGLQRVVIATSAVAADMAAAFNHGKIHVD